ncbi:MAG: hypothetical protein ACI4ST_06295, partial [Candidatus Gallimonas sp.]
MKTPQQVWEGIKSVFTDFHWTFVLVAVFLFCLIYFVFKTLRENNAGKLIFAYVFLLLCPGVLALFSESFDVETYYIFIMILSLFFLLLFSVEIKRS